jgi:putative heme iron utilization protein
MHPNQITESQPRSMKEEASRDAARLIRHCHVAALGTTSDGAPAVSQVPFALLPVSDCAFVILVSRLAAHTRAMQADPRVGLMIAQPENEHPVAHALARITIAAESHMIARSHPDYGATRAAYVARFPDQEFLFDLGDFELLAIVPRAVRVVAGFAQAASITPAALSRAVREGDVAA